MPHNGNMAPLNSSDMVCNRMVSHSPKAVRSATRGLLLAGCLLVAAPGSATTIAFGSCLRQWQPQPVWTAILAATPDAFIFAGDNVYTDTGPYRDQAEPARIGRAYDELAASPGYRALRDAVPVFATWDDHDYGRNDAGADYPWQNIAKREFVDFFDFPAGDAVRDRPGVYHVRTVGEGERRVQVILLDTRTFRSPLVRAEPTADCPRVNHAPNRDPDATLLGAAQWRWLEARLREPAALRLVVSSIQVIPEEHCFEKWANFPRERERLFELIRSTGAQGVVVVSGDRHLGEISRLPPEALGYPLYEVTASGMNSAGAGLGEQNTYRTTPDNVRQDHFGLVRLVGEGENRVVHLEIRDVTGAVLLQDQVPLERLRAP